jgi:hypothetical protein
MIRILKYWVLGIVGLLLSSCSWLTTFVVINASGTAASVTYAISFDRIEKSDCLPLLFFGEPRMAPSDEMWKLTDQRELLPEVDYKCDNSAGSISLILPPGHAVAISREVNFTGGGNTQYSTLQGTTLAIRGQRGEVQYSGQQLVRAFDRDSKKLYLLTYR